MKNNLLNKYKRPNQTYTGIDPVILEDDYKAVAEREMLYKNSYRYYYDDSGNRLTYRDQYPSSKIYAATNRKQMRLVDGEENPGRSLEEWLGESCEDC